MYYAIPVVIWFELLETNNIGVAMSKYLFSAIVTIQKNKHKKAEN